MSGFVLIVRLLVWRHSQATLPSPTKEHYVTLDDYVFDNVFAITTISKLSENYIVAIVNRDTSQAFSKCKGI